MIPPADGRALAESSATASEARASTAPGLRLRHRVAAAALSGVLLILSFPKFGWAALAWVALIPMLAAVEGTPPRRAFWLGGLAGIVGYTGIFSWVTVTMTRYGGLPLPAAWWFALMLAVYLGLYTAAFCAALCRFGRGNPPLRFALAPFLWTALELLRTHLLTGLPWASLGYSQSAALPVIQVADLTGVYGVSFLIVLVNAALWGALRARIPGLARGGGRTALWELGVAAALVAAALLYGRARLETFRPPPGGGSLKVALIQGNISQDLKWSEENLQKSLDTYLRLTLESAREKPDLIVWPETAAPFFFFRDKDLQAIILDVAAAGGAPILVGAPSVEGRAGRYRLRNGAFLVTPEKRVDDRYDKMHLVPYGEYVPLQRWFPFIRKMVTGIGDFIPGKRRTVFRLAKAPFSVLICYEVIFPDEVRRFVREGARFLVNITNDAWFGRSAAPYQHMAMAALRAVENRVPLVRAANTGITGVVDATGRIREATDLFVQTRVIARVEPGAGLTFYTRYGDAFAYLSAGVTLLIFALTWRPTRGAGGGVPIQRKRRRRT